MYSPDNIVSTQDVYFDIPEELALDFQIDQRVTFSGTIVSTSEFLGSISLTLEDVVLEP